jgi:hypothetical protein
MVGHDLLSKDAIMNRRAAIAISRTNGFKSSRTNYDSKSTEFEDLSFKTSKLINNPINHCNKD